MMNDEWWMMNDYTWWTMCDDACDLFFWIMSKIVGFFWGFMFKKMDFLGCLAGLETFWNRSLCGKKSDFSRGGIRFFRFWAPNPSKIDFLEYVKNSGFFTSDLADKSLNSEKFWKKNQKTNSTTRKFRFFAT